MNAYLHDQFPADVHLPDGTVHRQVLVVVDDERLQAWKDAWPSPVLVHESLHTGFTRGQDPRYPSSRHQVVTDAGTVQIATSSGCGCGSQLRQWRPDVPHRTASRA